ncbi:unnamed protein product [Echinostoma caproni]|uniref:Uncharacterized protein n=1 Tax=Echinostoma caproni TaxID=27848 RepID=A0A183AA67_9TREM|nr:unnamed protein product [Echinostoma caproni]
MHQIRSEDYASANDEFIDPASSSTKITKQKSGHPEVPNEEILTLALRNSLPRRVQFEEALLREESCGYPGLRDDTYPGAAYFLASQLRGILRASASAVQCLRDPVRDC